MKTKNVRTTWAALLTAALLLAPAVTWGQATTKYGVRAGDANVTKVNETSITTGGAVGVDESSLTTITIAPPAENKVAKVTVTKLTEAGTIPATAITISQADSKTEVAIGGTLQLTATTTPSYANSTITWTSSNTALATVDNTGKVTGVAEGSVTITAKSSDNENVSASYTPLTVKVPYKDLSLYDNAGNERSDKKMTTANSYMVHTKGVWGIPLVYGNAIKGGEVNAAAYTGVSGTNTTATFPNHAGNAINAPWITKATNGTGVNKGMGITVDGAALVWEDYSGLIKDGSLKIDGDYLTFELTKDATSQEGNAVIAAKSGSTIVWSWHIWVTNQTFATTTSVNTGSHIYNVAPVNLGWVGSNSTNTFYQWGRKDPFKGSGNVTTAAGGASTSIADNIKNPAKFYTNNGSPCSTTYYNMWDAQNTATSNVATATKKTVYDPCPPGFCVPTGNLYYYMVDGNTKQDSNWNNNGKTFNGIFFPASSYRNNSSGTLGNVGSDGYYWSASPTSSDSGYTLHFNSSTWDWGNFYRAFGIPVRAVAE